MTNLRPLESEQQHRCGRWPIVIPLTLALYSSIATSAESIAQAEVRRFQIYMSFEFQNGAAAQLAQAQLQKDGFLTTGKVVVGYRSAPTQRPESDPSGTVNSKWEKWTVEAGSRERYAENDLESLAKYCQELAARVGSLCYFRATAKAGKDAG